MTAEDVAAAVLAQVVDIGPTPQAQALGEHVAHMVAARPTLVAEPDPAVLDTLRGLGRSAPAGSVLVVTVDFAALHAQVGADVALDLIAKLNDLSGRTS